MAGTFQPARSARLCLAHRRHGEKKEEISEFAEKIINFTDDLIKE
jgi:anthranilate phosphoribosyltransferase